MLVRVVVACFALLLIACTGSGDNEPSPTVVSFTAATQGPRTGLQAEVLPPSLTPVPACEVTYGNGRVPPGETRANPAIYEANGHFVGLWPDGMIVFKADGPGTVEPDGALSMKIFWWRPVIGGKLEISGRRLDASAPPLQAYIPDGYDGQYFQATGLIFPTQGCWEVTGRVGDASLTFVTLVLVQP